MNSQYTQVELGDAGVLAPGKWLWARAMGWMIALFFALASALAAVQFGLVALFGKVPWVAPAGTCVGLAMSYGVYVTAVRFGEKRWPSELSLRHAPLELFIGVLIGLGMFALVFASLRMMGVYTLSGPVSSDWGVDIARNLAIGLGEELLLRAVIFRLIMRAYGLTAAFAGSALLFGVLHLTNPNASLFAAAAIAIEAGLMLAAFYALTGRLWISIGLHAAWNYAQGPIFGARVSGNIEKGSIFQSAPVPGSPDLLSGGQFGPEASLSAIVFGLIIFVMVLAAIRRKARLTAPNEL